MTIRRIAKALEVPGEHDLYVRPSVRQPAVDLTESRALTLLIIASPTSTFYRCCRRGAPGTRRPLSGSGYRLVRETLNRQRQVTWLTTSPGCAQGINIGGLTGSASVLSLGLTVWQATLCDVIGSMIICFALVANGRPGGRWGVPFAVANRSAWGLRGAWFVVLNRLILSVCRAFQSISIASFPELTSRRRCLAQFCWFVRCRRAPLAVPTALPC